MNFMLFLTYRMLFLPHKFVSLNSLKLTIYFLKRWCKKLVHNIIKIKVIIVIEKICLLLIKFNKTVHDKIYIQFATKYTKKLIKDIYLNINA